MSGKSPVGLQPLLQDGLLNWVRGSAFPSAFGPLYLSFHSTTVADSGDELSAILGGRLPVTSADLSAPADFGNARQIVNTRAFVTNPASAGVTIATFALWSSASGGTRVWTGDVNPDVVIAQGDPAVFLAGDLILRVE